MRIHVPPGSPWWVDVAADAALTLHVGGGMTALVSGATAAFAPKGRRLHALAGRLFVAAMLVMAGVGAIVAPLLPQRMNIAAGVFTIYLVLSAWSAARRKPGDAGRVEVATLLIGIAAFAICAWLIWVGSQSAEGVVDGQDYHPLIVFAALAALGVFLDVRMLRRGGITGVSRIARHLWRMCLALFIASASFFLGQPQLFPTWLSSSNALFIPALVPLVLLIVWMLRLRIGRRWRTVPSC